MCFVADLPAHLIDMGELTGLQLPLLALDPPLASLTPGPDRKEHQFLQHDTHITKFGRSGN